MQQFDAGTFAQAMRIAARFSQHLMARLELFPGRGVTFPEDSLTEDLRLFDEIERQSQNHGMPLTRKSAHYLVERLRTLLAGRRLPSPIEGGAPVVPFEPMDIKGIEGALDELISRMKDELELKLVLSVSTERADFYSQPTPLLGTEFANKFPSAVFEVDEAGKCFALDRHTAAVFHLMRVMEIGINAAHQCLGLPPLTKKQSNWGAVLKGVKDELDRRSKAKPPLWTQPGDEQLFAGIHALLDSVRIVWRNPTMHVEIKYTGEEASHIFGAVRAFMSKLAARMDERGDPKA